MTDQQYTADDNRRTRIGFDEAILCDSKRVENIDAILTDAANKQIPLLLTRLREDQLGQLAGRHRERIDYDPVSRTGWYRKTSNDSSPEGTAQVAVVTAGTSDVPVAQEAVRTLAYNDVPVDEIYDVGVAGIWRLMDRVEALRNYRVIIAVAGMDAALPSVLGGLVPGSIVAVPTSVGYGVATGGSAALNALLASCAPGIAVVNIDNGYGAACAALRVIASSN